MTLAKHFLEAPIYRMTTSEALAHLEAYKGGEPTDNLRSYITAGGASELTKYFAHDLALVAEVQASRRK